MHKYQTCTVILIGPVHFSDINIIGLGGYPHHKLLKYVLQSLVLFTFRCCLHLGVVYI